MKSQTTTFKERRWGPWILILTTGPPFFGVMGFSLGEPSSQQTAFSAFRGDTSLSKEGKVVETPATTLHKWKHWVCRVRSPRDHRVLCSYDPSPESLATKISPILMNDGGMAGESLWSPEPGTLRTYTFGEPLCPSGRVCPAHWSQAWFPNNPGRC